MPTAQTNRLREYHILVRIRDESDGLRWVQIGRHSTRSQVALALDEWLLEETPLPGDYRAESVVDGGFATRPYLGESA